VTRCRAPLSREAWSNPKCLVAEDAVRLSPEDKAVGRAGFGNGRRTGGVRSLDPDKSDKDGIGYGAREGSETMSLARSKMVCTALVSGRRSRKATARLLGKQDAGQAKAQVVGASPGSLASVVERMAESEAGRPFVWRGVYVRRARGVGVQMRVAYWLAASELLGSGSHGEMGQERRQRTRQASRRDRARASAARRRGGEKKSRRAGPKSKRLQGTRRASIL